MKNHAIVLFFVFIIITATDVEKYISFLPFEASLLC